MAKRHRTKPTRFLLASAASLLVTLLMVRALIMPLFEQQQQDFYQYRLNSSAAAIADFIEARKAEIRSLSNTTTLQSMDWAQIRPFLLTQKSIGQRNFEKLVLGLPNGHFYTTLAGNPHADNLATFDDASPTAKPKSITQRDYWQVTVGRNIKNQRIDYVSNPMISYTTGIKQVIVASSIHDDQNNVIGLLGGSISWRKITELIHNLSANTEGTEPPEANERTKAQGPSKTQKQSKIKEPSKIKAAAAKYMLVSKDGNYWYHWQPEKVIHVQTDDQGKEILDRRGEKSVELFNILAEKSDSLKSIGRNMVSGKKGNGQALFDGEEYQVFFTPISNTNYSLAKAIRLSEYHAPMWQLVIYLLVAFLAGLFVYIFSVYLIPREPSS